jgi:hypothetical protein
MQFLRSARFLARLVLAWFVLALGVAVAAPVIHPKSMELVCASGGAMKLVVTSSDGTVSGEHGHTLDCPLCLTATAAPLPGMTPMALRLEEPAHKLHARTQPVFARIALALPPSRAPPHSL